MIALTESVRPETSEKKRRVMDAKNRSTDRFHRGVRIQLCLFPVASKCGRAAEA
jgi:hypothetical protein